MEDSETNERVTVAMAMDGIGGCHGNVWLACVMKCMNDYQSVLGSVLTMYRDNVFWLIYNICANLLIVLAGDDMIRRRFSERFIYNNDQCTGNSVTYHPLYNVMGTHD